MMVWANRIDQRQPRAGRAPHSINRSQSDGLGRIESIGGRGQANVSAHTPHARIIAKRRLARGVVSCGFGGPMSRAAGRLRAIDWTDPTPKHTQQEVAAGMVLLGPARGRAAARLLWAGSRPRLPPRIRMHDPVADDACAGGRGWGRGRRFCATATGAGAPRPKELSFSFSGALIRVGSNNGMALQGRLDPTSRPLGGRCGRSQSTPQPYQFDPAQPEGDGSCAGLSPCCGEQLVHPVGPISSQMDDQPLTPSGFSNHRGRPRPLLRHTPPPCQKG